jgi:hypothetical protein
MTLAPLTITMHVRLVELTLLIAGLVVILCQPTILFLLVNTDLQLWLAHPLDL